MWIIIVGFITLLLTLYIAYKDFFEGPNIDIYAGDRINIVKSEDCKARKIQVACTFTNTSRKAGIVNKIAVLLKKANEKNSHLFEWLVFYDYHHGPHTIPSTGVCPISVPANNSNLQGIEFITKDEIDWREGEYSLEIYARIEKKSLLRKKKTSDQFTVILSKQYIYDLKKEESLKGPELRTVIIEGRELKKEDIK